MNQAARLGVVLERIFHANPERGKQQGSGQSLCVHHCDAGITVAVFGPDRLEVAERFNDLVLMRVAAVPLVERPGFATGSKTGLAM